MFRFAMFSIALAAAGFISADAQAQCGSHSYVSTAPVTRVYRSSAISYPTPARQYASAPVRYHAPASRYSASYVTPVRQVYAPRPAHVRYAAPVASPTQRVETTYRGPSATSLLSRPTCANGTCGR